MRDDFSISTIMTSTYLHSIVYYSLMLLFLQTIMHQCVRCHNASNVKIPLVMNQLREKRCRPRHISAVRPI